MLATMDACRFEIGTKAAEIVAARALGIGEVGEQRVILTPEIIRGDTLRAPGQ
jgi:LacI family gluconate utilization system Gnt-I transcriptional repressor